MAEEERFDVELKILIIGDAGVGKTCLLLRFTDDAYTENYVSTIGFDYKTKVIEVDNVKVRLQIWDTAGQERFRGITQSYYRGAHGIIVAYDVTDKESFNNATTHWLEDLQRYGSANSKTMLVGCKIDDVNREVDFSDGKSKAEQLHLLFFETSSSGSLNVEKCFSSLVSQILSTLDLPGVDKNPKKGVVTVSNTRQHVLPKDKNCAC